MDIYKFEELLRLSEGNTIDFKRTQYDFSGEDKTEKVRKRANFVKDIISFYNTPRKEESYIVLGVKKYPNGEHDLVGVDKHLDDAEFQSKFDNFIYPHPTLQYCPVEYKGKSYGVIIIPPDRANGPCVPLNDIGNILHRHQIYVRQGSQNATADGDMQKRVHRWFSESNPAEQLENTGNRAWDSFLQATDRFDPSYNYVLVISPIVSIPDCRIESLGALPWSFVFDFCPDSEQSGLLNNIQETIRANRSLHLITKLDSQSINLVRGTYWYFARGMSGRETTLSTGTWLDWKCSYGSDIASRVKSLESSSGARPFKVIVLWDSDDLIKHLYTLLEEFLSHLRGTAEIIIVSLRPSNLLEEIGTNIRCTVLFIPLHQICSGIQRYHSAAMTKGIVYLPSSSGSSVEIDPQKLNWLEEQFEVLHEGKGHSPSGKEEPRRDFLRGNEPSWYELAIRSDIDRDKYSKILETVRNDLVQRRTYRINLYHAPGAGGTTVARRLLWDMHKVYPCLVAKSALDESTVDRIQYVFGQTGTSILIKLDGSRISDSQIDIVYDLLVARHVPAVLLQVQRRTVKIYERQRSLYLNSLLSDNEANIMGRYLCEVVPNRANAIQKAIRQKNIRKTPFILSLIAFEDNFVGVDEYVKARIENLTESQKNILIFISMCYYYGQQTIPAQVFVPLAGIPKFKVVDLRKLFPEIVLDLLMETNTGIWRPAHQIIAEACLKILLSPVGGDIRIWKQRISTVARDFIDFLTDGDHSLPDDIMEIVRRVFVYRDNLEIFSTESANRKFSRLIEDIPSQHGQLGLLMYLKDAFPLEAHFWAHLGRFYAHSMGQYEKAIQCIDRAIKIHPDDHVLHHIKGIAIRKDLYERIERQITLDEITELAARASECFKRTRDLSPKKEHGYISEIEMIIRIVDYVGKNAKSAVSAIAKTSKNPWLLEAVECAEALLDDVKRNRGGERAGEFEINCIARLNRLYGDYSQSIEKWQNLLERREVYAPPVRRQIVRTYLARARRNWSYLKQHEIKRIVRLLKENLNEETANEKDLRLWIQATRWLDAPPSLDSILEQVAYWRTSTGDLDAIFYQYVLNTLISLETGSSDAAGQARISMDECKNRALKLRSHTWSYEWLGEGRGIKRLVHHSLLGEWSKSNDFWKNPKGLTRIRGVIAKIKGPESGKIELDCGFKAFFVPSRSNHVKNRDENVAVTGYLGFSYDGLRFWEVKNA